MSENDNNASVSYPTETVTHSDPRSNDDRDSRISGNSNFFPSSNGTFSVPLKPLDITDIENHATRVRFDIYKCEQVHKTSSSPFRAIGYLSNGSTGVLVGPRHVLTAGHCVYSKKTGTWYKNLTFTPGMNQSDKPFGTFAVERSYTVRGWSERGDLGFDYGMVVLKQRIGDKLGWMGVGYSDKIESFALNLVGYPSDRPHGTMWRSFGPIESASDNTILHKLDIWYGNSGGPAYRFLKNRGTRIIYGVQSWHRTSGNKINGAKRINKDAYATILSWINANPGGQDANIGGPDNSPPPAANRLIAGKWKTTPGDEQWTISTGADPNRYNFRYRGVFIKGKGYFEIQGSNEIIMEVQTASGGSILGRPIPTGTYTGTISNSRSFIINGVSLDNKVVNLSFSKK